VAKTNATGILSGMSNSAEIKQRLVFVFFALIVYRIGTFIPIPGVNPANALYLCFYYCSVDDTCYS